MIKTGEDYCPNCKKTLDAATGLSDRAIPNPGDFSTCFYCGIILRYASDMDLRMALPDELLELEPEERIKLFKAAAIFTNRYIQRN